MEEPQQCPSETSVSSSSYWLAVSTSCVTWRAQSFLRRSLQPTALMQMPRPTKPLPLHTVMRAVTRGHVILGLFSEKGLVLQVVIALNTAHQRTIRPIVKHPADRFPRGAGHCGKVALGDLLLNDDAPFAHVAAELFGKVQ